jgi:hypothetical protein
MTTLTMPPGSCFGARMRNTPMRRVVVYCWGAESEVLSHALSCEQRKKTGSSCACNMNLFDLWMQGFGEDVKEPRCWAAHGPPYGYCVNCFPLKYPLPSYYLYGSITNHFGLQNELRSVFVAFLEPLLTNRSMLGHNKLIGLYPQMR